MEQAPSRWQGEVEDFEIDAPDRPPRDFDGDTLFDSPGRRVGRTSRSRDEDFERAIGDPARYHNANVGTWVHQNHEGLKGTDIAQPDMTRWDDAGYTARNDPGMPHGGAKVIPLQEIPSDGLVEVEVPIGQTGGRADVVLLADDANGVIYEIKPDNLDGVQEGLQQAERYARAASAFNLEGRTEYQYVVAVYNQEAAMNWFPSSD